MDTEKSCCPVVEFTYEELMMQNKSLSEELALCQKDKDFVWDLWRSLQEERPDITEIISKVVEREQEKSDVKDLKILLMFQQKDSHIKNLEEKSIDLQVQLKNASERVSTFILEEQEWKESRKQFENEKQKLTRDLEVLTEKFNSPVLSKLRVKESHSNIMEAEAMSRISMLQHKNADLHESIHKLQKEISALNDTIFSKDAIMQNYRLQSETNQASAEQKIKEKDTELETVKKENQCYLQKFEKLEFEMQEYEAKLFKQDKELQDFPEMINKINNMQAALLEQEEKLSCKETELLNLRNDLNNHLNCSNHISEQSNLIKKLQNLQDETQNVIAKQKADHQLELQSFEKRINGLLEKIQKQQKLFMTLTEENKILSAENKIFQEKRDEEKNGIQDQKEECKKCEEKEENLTKLQENYNLLANKYKENSSKFSLTNEVLNKELFQSKTTLSEYLSNNPHDKLSKCKEKVKKLQNLTKSMGDELCTLQSAHKQMQQRYKVLEQKYDLVLQQLKTYEVSPQAQHFLNDSQIHVRRASAKSLQQEDSQTVWNELEYFRKECEKLNADREALLVEIDALQVKSTHEVTIINQLEFQVTKLKEALIRKEEELGKKVAQCSQMYTQKQKMEDKVEMWKDKLNACKEEMYKMNVIIDGKNDENRSLSKKLSSVTSELTLIRNNLIKVTTTSSTQTHELYKAEELLEKMNEVIEVVQNDRIAVSQLASQSSRQTSCSISTQTNSNRIAGKETQTNVIMSAEVEENIKVKKKKMLREEAKQLALFNTDTFHENRSLKKRVLSLENQVSQLRDSKNSLNKLVLELESSNAKLKEELVSTLQKLQASKEYLQARNCDLEDRTQELNAILDEQQKANLNSINSAAELKATENRLRVCMEECSKLSFQAKTIKQENDMLTEKLKCDQEKIAMLEKGLSQKKSMISELKQKNTAIKKENEEDSTKSDRLKEQLKEANEREKKSKLYAETLKSKIDALTNEVSTLRTSFAECKLNLQTKTRLLEESQHLCKQAEVAINEMENSAFQHLKSQQKSYDESKLLLSDRYEKSATNVNELKKAIKVFTESILTQIHSYRSYTESTRKLSAGQQDGLADGQISSKAHDLACSILNMSISDLQEFMVAPLEEFSPPMYRDNDIREKLEMILQKETNFAAILGRFLLDLVEYSNQLSPHLISSEEFK